MEDDEETLEANRQSHLEWLRAQHADFESHKAQSIFYDEFTLGGLPLDDDFPVYRSLNMAGPSELSHDFEDEPVYRSMDLSNMGSASESRPSPESRPVGDPSSSWVAAKRPPLLRRQNAFAVRDTSGDPSWMNLLDGNMSGQ